MSADLLRAAIAANAAGPRWPGRAHALRRAEAFLNYYDAVRDRDVAWEYAWMLSLSPAERLRMVLTWGPETPRLIRDSFLVPGAILHLRRARAECRAGDLLRDRLPGHAIARAAARLAREGLTQRICAANPVLAAMDAALACARFRETLHGSDTTIRLVPPGAEGAVSTTTTVNPRDVGLPNAYARKGFHVTTSQHVWAVSRAILDAPPASAGLLYLTPTLRVRQGRGTALVVERLDGRWT